MVLGCVCDTMRDVAECPSCSAALPSNKAKFCPRCGAALGAAGVHAGAADQTTKVRAAGPSSPLTPAEKIAPPRTPPRPIVTEIPPSAKSIRLERRGSLLNRYVLGSIAVILAGALCAGDGHLVTGSILLFIGLPTLLISTVRSLAR